MKQHSGYGQAHRVNTLKKANVDGKWSLFPAVVEPNGKLKDKIRIKGKIEVHPEGTYYIEWWQGGQRRQECKSPLTARATAEIQRPRSMLRFRNFSRMSNHRSVSPRRMRPTSIAGNFSRTPVQSLLSKKSCAKTCFGSPANNTTWGVAHAPPSGVQALRRLLRAGKNMSLHRQPRYPKNSALCLIF